MDRGLTHSASFKMISSHSTLVCNVMLSIKRLHSGGTTSQYTSVLQVRPASTEEYTEDAVYRRIPMSVGTGKPSTPWLPLIPVDGLT